jgi:uncharacterized membrane protein YccC
MKIKENIYMLLFSFFAVFAIYFISQNIQYSFFTIIIALIVIIAFLINISNKIGDFFVRK